MEYGMVWANIRFFDYFFVKYQTILIIMCYLDKKINIVLLIN